MVLVTLGVEQWARIPGGFERAYQRLGLFSAVLEVSFLNWSAAAPWVVLIFIMGDSKNPMAHSCILPPSIRAISSL